MALRAVALRLPEAALASSAAARLAAASSPGGSASTHLLQIYASEAAFASLSASAYSAVRRAALNAVACGPKEHDAALISTTAADDDMGSALPSESPAKTHWICITNRVRAASEYASKKGNSVFGKQNLLPVVNEPTTRVALLPSATTSIFIAITSRCGLNLDSAASEGEVVSTTSTTSSGLFLPTTTTASSSGFFRPTATSSSGLFRPTSATSFLVPTAAARAGTARFVTSAGGYNDPYSMTDDEEDIDDLISRMSMLHPKSEEALKFRKAYYKKFFPYWDAYDAAEYLQHQR